MRFREPRFSVNVRISENNNGVTTQQNLTFNGEKPKELMDSFKNVIGDGQASVSVSTDISLKSFGNGVSAMVSVSLTCDQSVEGINQAAVLAAQAARHFAKQFQSEAEMDLKSTMLAQGRKVEF